jgi:hypothetical protein
VAEEEKFVIYRFLIGKISQNLTADFGVYVSE